MLNFLLFCILAFFCWPLAIAALILYPLIWLILLPFRLVGIVVGGTFGLIAALFSLPGRMLRAI
ncbi:MAG TPA: hypothetical protein VH117_00035 [Edaphobacter sp.]|jgi:hypothetical protein|nr:hypothetical protein [Edaphobacter sp.]